MIYCYFRTAPLTLRSSQGVKGKVAMKKVIIIIIVILNIRIFYVKKVLCWKLYKIIIFFCQLWDMVILNHQFLIYSIAATCLYAIFEGIPTIWAGLNSENQSKNHNIINYLFSVYNFFETQN